jgi:type 1 glutamine amidotransferase
MLLRNQLYRLLLFITLLSCVACNDRPETASVPDDGAARPYIVFVTGDEEYRSEESMPMLAKLAERELNARVNVCYALDSLGFVDPNNNQNIEGLEALKDADLMVLFTRWRALPDDQLQQILDFAESGKPMVGFRTSTHAFLYKNDSTKAQYNDEWSIKVFGQKWITHHGHFKDGHNPLTDVSVVADKANHPILTGFEPFKAYSWLYHVEGSGYSLYGDSDPLLRGKSLRSNYAESKEFPLTNPVAWTKSYTGDSGNKARVFFTTLGHPFDFQETSMRRLALNGIAWALGEEAKIPAAGFDVSVEGYDPNNSGFGQKFKAELRPRMMID